MRRSFSLIRLIGFLLIKLVRILSMSWRRIPSKRVVCWLRTVLPLSTRWNMAIKVNEHGEVIMDERGREIPDPTPLEIPAGFKKPETLDEMVQRLVRQQLSHAAGEAGAETFEEAEDFDVDDDSFDPSSPYEEVFDPVLGRGITLEEFHKHGEIYRQRFLEAERKSDEAFLQSDALRVRRKRLAEPSGAPPSGGARPVDKSDKPVADGSKDGAGSKSAQ